MKVSGLVLASFFCTNAFAQISGAALICNSEFVASMKAEYPCVIEAARAAAGVALAEYGDLSPRSCVELTQVLPLPNEAFIVSTNNPLHYLVQVEKNETACELPK